MGGIIRAGREIQGQYDANPIAFNFADVKQQADEYLSQVRKQAQQQIKQAQLAADQIREQARREGEAAAAKQARQELQLLVKEQIEQLVPALSSEFDRLASRRDEWVHEWEQQAIKFVVRIAERVIQRELTNSCDIPLGLIREALEVVVGSRRCEIRLNPDDFELLQAQIDQITRGPSRVMEVNTATDSNVPRGGVEIVTDQGEIDQRLESRLQRIEAELLAD